MTDTSIWLWAGFNLFVLALLALDLGVFHRKAHAVSLREAAVWSVVWVGLALYDMRNARGEVEKALEGRE